MRRTTTIVCLVLTVLTTLAAAPSSRTTFTTVATEPCVAGPDANGLASPDWEDLCTVAFATVAAGDDVPSTLAVRLTAVGPIEDRPVQMVYLTRWTVGDCAIEMFHRDENADAVGEDLALVRCGHVEGECEQVTVVDACGPDGAGLDLEVPVAAPVRAVSRACSRTASDRCTRWSTRTGPTRSGDHDLPAGPHPRLAPWVGAGFDACSTTQDPA